MPKGLAIRNAILCDYVGRGFANKHILVNVISGNVLVPSFPQTVTFGVFVEFEVPETGASTLNLEITLGGKVLLQGEGMPGAVSKGEPGVFVLPTLEFVIEQDTVFEVAISMEGFERIVAISKRISLNPGDPSVWPPLSAQSEYVALGSSSQPEPSRQAAPKKRRRSKAQ